MTTGIKIDEIQDENGFTLFTGKLILEKDNPEEYPLILQASSILTELQKTQGNFPLQDRDNKRLEVVNSILKCLTSFIREKKLQKELEEFINDFYIKKLP